MDPKKRYRIWSERMGLSIDNEAAALGVSRATASRLRGGSTVPSVAILSLCASILDGTMATFRENGRALDEAASELDFAYVCSVNPHAVVTGLTAARARGWSTMRPGNRRHVALPLGVAAMAVPGVELAVIRAPADGEGVEVRNDANGLSYRIADPIRTVLDLMDSDDVSDAVKAETLLDAVELGEVDRVALKISAILRGEEHLSKIKAIID